mgnify:CR=1 FL=1
MSSIVKRRPDLTPPPDPISGQVSITLAFKRPAGGDDHNDATSLKQLITLQLSISPGQDERLSLQVSIAQDF